MKDPDSHRKQLVNGSRATMCTSEINMYLALNLNDNGCTKFRTKTSAYINNIKSFLGHKGKPKG